MKIELRGENFVLDPARCLYWEEEALLVVADFHLGKSETFQREGLWLPSQANTEDLNRLSQAIVKFEAQRVLFLGDLVHSNAGMTEDLIEAFAAWLSRYSGAVDVVIGNHDVKFAKRWPQSWNRANLVDHYQCRNFIFQHEPPSEKPKLDEPFCWAGHIHPTVVLAHGPERLRLPSYVITKSTGLLPAFSSLAGGHNISRSPSRRIFAVTPERTFEF